MNTSECGREAPSVPPLEGPEREYARRSGVRERQVTNIRNFHGRLWVYLGAAALGCMVFTFAAFSAHWISRFWILLPCVAAVAVLRALVRNAQFHGSVERIVCFYEFGVARLSHRWQGRGDGGEEFRPVDHAYASDLDLFGAGSLFELLCTARTGIGRATLAHWLISRAQCEEVTERQVAIAELTDELALREDWASVKGGGLDRGAASLREWANAPAITFPFYARIAAIVLPVCLVILSLVLGAGAVRHSGERAVAAIAALEAILATSLRKKTNLIAQDLVVPLFELELLAPLLLRFEELSFQCPLLKSLQAQLAVSAGHASRQIRQLHVWGWLLHLRRFEYFAVLASPLLWGTNFAILTERWRQKNRTELGRWLDSLGQFEALLCLARYSYENPDHTFAVIKRESPALFDAESLGHPLLDRRTCVRCDVQLDARGTRLMIVSGSNMSGKSTLLRSMGLNSVLAMAGAPVRAARLQMAWLEIGCSIAVHDSLLQAKSRFQAEVERLTLILALARRSKLLFLLDEMLGGTNSADRLFGARAVIQQLIESCAVGAVTTHDLALTEIAKDFKGQAINVHFEEHYEGGEMRFDYQMRHGVLRRTNGINVMAALGLLPKEG